MATRNQEGKADMRSELEPKAFEDTWGRLTVDQFKQSPPGSTLTSLLLSIYKHLYDHFGPQHWWPAETPFEVIVGAILTQNVSWRNVERALANLKERGLLTPESLAQVPEEELGELLRPAGYFRGKARKIKAFLAHLFTQHQGQLERLLNQPADQLREELLGLWGIGPETADSIVLYAAGQPSFVVDAYTLRIFSRLGLLPAGTRYQEARDFFQKHLPPDGTLFNEYHALLVALGKDYCRKRRPRCNDCPLQRAGHCRAAQEGLFATAGSALVHPD